MKTKIKNILKKTLTILKTILFTVVMFVGFWTIYTMIWIIAGLTDANWALWMLAALAAASEYLFLRFM
jgi:hypothetical protein